MARSAGLFFKVDGGGAGWGGTPHLMARSAGLFFKLDGGGAGWGGTLHLRAQFEGLFSNSMVEVQAGVELRT